MKESNLKLVFFILAALVLGCAETSRQNTDDGVILGDYPEVETTLKPAKVGKGRTADEKIYEFDLPASRWIETSVKVKPNQELLVHHFTSSEQVKVNFGGVTDTRLREPGKVIPIFVARSCDGYRGINDKVAYRCIGVSEPQGVKLYSAKPQRVAIAVKDH
ncbi:hypothetical protein [Leptolyngbya sp. 7M]|uniref:hypothetical protein n=1 Tax=Leptolyngbya sp. 7M TaxID=2812896 RepID=UPI001B8C1500|nr:hypothetical protein [Leptolyngbya sp. 7M]QYO65299.1 hypothetical protein JVX88_00500 [Leptolyngbya sp. 7M]QYU67274.1 hypothetical protein J4558_20395 [Leptolyngbya sp. 15MV]